ncbi:hypothetical protein RB614_40460 [Phytohabitans sp. ZYX-F-186]|uniref:Uncharacterized protein n=1 Tax=Phytohabitans maris TaxID=3071409 RepID=A0ABU0ZUR2_9ACTN|nr:hypothetical protein [Phytohabitans sp. ZYX-F-186]MDQ7910783.1 hypothetical protein [Phytohabitans sp. ZYX-F-186]
MAENRRPVRVPDGHYAVPDPDDPARLTLWSVCAGVARDYPETARWRPTPPPIEGPSKDARQAIRQDWYDRVYFPWRAAVAVAIERDPEGAAAAFVAAQGYVPVPVRPARRRSAQPAWAKRMRAGPTAAQRRREELGLLALALRGAGRSVRETADLLGEPRSTIQRLSADCAGFEAADVATRAVTLLRIDQLEQQLLVARVTASGELAAELDRQLGQVAEMRAALRALIVPPRGRDGGIGGR